MNCIITITTVLSLLTPVGYIDKQIETKQIFENNLYPESATIIKYNKDYSKRWYIMKDVVCGDNVESVSITSTKVEKI